MSYGWPRMRKRHPLVQIGDGVGLDARFGLRREQGFVWLIAALAASAGFCWLRLETCLELPYASYRRMLDGTADTPFQHRMLVPLIGRGVSALVGPVDPTFVLDVGSLALVLLIGARYARRLGRSPLWAAAALYLMVAVNYAGPFGYNMRECYDMPALLFALPLTLALRERRYGVYYAILPFALVNRESAAFLVILFALTQAGGLTRRAFLGHLAVQTALVVLIKGTLLLIYRHSPGAGALSFYPGPAHSWATSRLHDNLWWVATLRIAPIFGGMWVPLVILRHRLTDPFTRHAMLLVPVVFAVMMLVGNAVEFRIYTELVPVIYLGLLSIAGVSLVRRPA